MSERWEVAMEMARILKTCERDRSILRLLAQLPFLSEGVLEQLAGASSRSLYPRLGQFVRSGLVAAMSPSLLAGHSPRLLYLTDLGVATLAAVHEVEPMALAQRMRITRRQLIRLLPQLPALQATYRLLGAVAASCPRPVKLVQWERPWRRSYLRATASSPVRVSLPALAAFSWNGGGQQCLLVPDQGLIPMRVFRSTLRHLLVMRVMNSGRLPILVVATNAGRRASAWKAALQETAEEYREEPLRTCIASWSELYSDLRILQRYEAHPEPEDLSSCVLHALPPLEPPLPCRRVPRIVGSLSEIRNDSFASGEQLAQASLVVTPADRQLLDFLGRHPFLSTGQLAALLDQPLHIIRHKCRRLERLGLVRAVAPEELHRSLRASSNTDIRETQAIKPGTRPQLDLMELTEPGLALMGAQCGLSARAAVRLTALIGGGPEQGLGPRAQLLRQIQHTVQTNDIFVSLVRSVRLVFRNSDREIMVTWRSAAASTRGALRPDWYAVVDHGPTSFGFFLEYDRGTESARDYRRKFAAYYAYLAARAFKRDYEDFPMILVVTTSNAAERRIAHAAQATLVGREQSLPLFLTSEWRIVDRSNLYGLLGPIWWEPSADFNDRRFLSFLRAESLRLPMQSASLHGADHRRQR